jgi:hypothetical protein
VRSALHLRRMRAATATRRSAGVATVAWQLNEPAVFVWQLSVLPAALGRRVACPAHLAVATRRFPRCTVSAMRRLVVPLQMCARRARPLASVRTGHGSLSGCTLVAVGAREAVDARAAGAVDEVCRRRRSDKIPRLPSVHSLTQAYSLMSVQRLCWAVFLQRCCCGSRWCRGPSG